MFHRVCIKHRPLGQNWESQVCAGMHLPALRSEGIAAQRIRSSSSRHCRAMRMATKVAKESWKDKSLTWKRGDQSVIQTASTSFPLSAIPRSWVAEGPITPGQCPWSAQAATNTNGSPWCSKPFPCSQKTKPPSLVQLLPSPKGSLHFCFNSFSPFECLHLHQHCRGDHWSHRSHYWRNSTKLWAHPATRHLETCSSQLAQHTG